MDPVIRPGNSLLLLALQSAEGTPAVPSAATDIVPFESDSLTYSGPYKSEQTDEANGTFVAGAPLVMGQAATITWKSRLKGAGAGVTYTSTIKPPLHSALSICGWLGQFTAAVAAAALAAGTTSAATLGVGFAATAQAYRGIPLALTGAPAAGRRAQITDYSVGKVATLADLYGTALSATNTGAIAANWTYAPTSPLDASSRLTMHPCGTLYLYEDGMLHAWTDCRATVDFEGDAAKPGFAVFSVTGIYAGPADAAVPANPVYPGQSAPLLVQGVGGLGPVFQINRKGLPIAKWSMKANSSIETPADPNSNYGFAPGQISDRGYVLQCDPKQTFVATRNVLAEIAAFSQYSGALQFGSTAGNRVTLTLPLMQPTEATPATAGKLRTQSTMYQVMTPGRDNANRDGDAILCFD